ncbi:glycosyltransferase family 9 protein [Vibrio algicola]|uniref:Lipopolysaccharide heptosyltransferase family protein n=1 Tax=Vibrio algicola TaxID=2662262 RepID=A0A5Q0TFU1_9VIBR|nr:glycosyltransferase family 9 protein [Vibrio algicola]
MIDKKNNLIKEQINIAVFVPNRAFFGNITTQLPFLCALKKEHPNSIIDVWSKNEKSKLLISSGGADNLILYKNISFLKLTKNLRSNRYYYIFNLYPASERVHWAIKLSGTMNTFSFISSKLHSLCYKYTLIEKKNSQYIACRFLKLINYFYGTNYSSVIISSLSSQPEMIINQRASLTIIPGGGAGSYKRWDIKKYCRVALELIEKNNFNEPIQFILGPEEQHFQDVIVEKLKSISNKVYIINSPSIPELIDIAKTSRLTIANDCGPTHIFQMLESPLIMIWGWHDNGASPYPTLQEWFNSTENSWSIFPNEKTKNIQSITVDKVLSLARIQLSRNDEMMK